MALAENSKPSGEVLEAFEKEVPLEFCEIIPAEGFCGTSQPEAEQGTGSLDGRAVSNDGE